MDRLIEIETKLAFQEDALSALNEVVCQQQLQIDQLTATLKLLIDRYRSLSETQAGSKPVDEKPPHY